MQVTTSPAISMNQHIWRAHQRHATADCHRLCFIAPVSITERELPTQSGRKPVEVSYACRTEARKFLISTPTAAEFAKGCPIFPSGGSVEVRLLQGFNMGSHHEAIIRVTQARAAAIRRILLGVRERRRFASMGRTESR